jgi:Flp pilus assembly protein CpaB
MNQRNPSDQPIAGTRLVVVALLLAILAVIVTNFYIERIRRQVAESSFDVYVLTRAVRPGVELSEKDVKRIAVPEKFEQAFTDLAYVDEEALQLRLADKEVFQRSADAGEIVTFRLFVPPVGRDLDRNITDGWRLVSLPVNNRTIPGALQEGMYVDIEAPFHTGGAAPVTMPVMERVKVIALGTNTVYDEDDSSRRRGSRSFRNITIEVTPAEATQLSNVQRIAAGEFELHLRNPSDTQRPKIDVPGINPEVLQLINRTTRQQSGGPARNR